MIQDSKENYMNIKNEVGNFSKNIEVTLEKVNDKLKSNMEKKIIRRVVEVKLV